MNAENTETLIRRCNEVYKRYIDELILYGKSVLGEKEELDVSFIALLASHKALNDVLNKCKKAKNIKQVRKILGVT